MVIGAAHVFVFFMLVLHRKGTKKRKIQFLLQKKDNVTPMINTVNLTEYYPALRCYERYRKYVTTLYETIL